MQPLYGSVDCVRDNWIGLSKVQRPTKHIISHIWDKLLWVKWPNQQVK